MKRGNQTYCIDCKKKIENQELRCNNCKKKDYELKISKKINRDIAKTHNTMVYGVMKVKSFAERRYWCTSHANCFRGSIRINGRGGESEEHLDKQYDRWKHHRKLGRTVFCNLILSNGKRPDLVIVDKGFIWIEEIVVSEDEKSIVEKRKNYPFPINVIKA